MEDCLKSEDNVSIYLMKLCVCTLEIWFEGQGIYLRHFQWCTVCAQYQNDINLHIPIYNMMLPTNYTRYKEDCLQIW